MTPFWRPLGLLCLFGSDRMRRPIAEAKSFRRFFCCDFGGCFNDRAQWIANLPSIFAVSVVNAPELPAGLNSSDRAHGEISAQPVCAKMYWIHKMRGQS